jgi:HD-like signal output (HDOD) protein
MTAKILQLANSAFFGLRRRIADPSEAVQHLGLDTLKSLVLAIHVFSKFEGMGNVDFPVAKLWRHSFRTAAMARRIAQLEQGEKKLVDESFTAGLLHDLGRLILVANLPEQYEQAATLVKRDGFRLIEAELATFRVTHAEVGGYLLGLWGLPVSIVEAAVFHHHPDRCQTRTFAPLTSVHISNVLEHEADRQLSPRLDDEYLATTGVKDQVPAWREALSRENKQESMP